MTNIILIMLCHYTNSYIGNVRMIVFITNDINVVMLLTLVQDIIVMTLLTL